MGRHGIWVGALVLLSLTPAWGQSAAPEKKPIPKKKAAPPLAIVNAKVAGYDRPVVVLIANGKIAQISARGRPPGRMRTVDAGGARVTPGRIDAFASLGEPDPKGGCLDAFDTYDTHAIQRALAGGVTTVVLTPLRSSSISGLAAVIKLMPNASLEERTLVREAALCTSLGLGRTSPSARATQVEGLRRIFSAARAYRDSWEDYEEELEKYTEKLAKGGDKKTKGGAKKTKRPPKPAKGGAPKKGGKKKPSGPKKPKQPRKDRAKDLLVRVLDRTLPLRVEAHRVADIVCLLELREEFGFELILEGATEGYLLAKVLAEREVPVVLGPIGRSTLTGARFPLRHSPSNAARLHAAGVQVLFGSDWWASTPSLQLSARQAVGEGLDALAAEDGVTHGVARLLGLGDRLGRVAEGYDADLVVTRRGPLGEEQVRAVLIEGEIVYRRNSK